MERHRPPFLLSQSCSLLCLSIKVGGGSVKIQMTDDQREQWVGCARQTPKTAALEPRHPLWVIDQCRRVSSVCVTQSWCKPSPGFLEEDAQFLLCV